MLKKILLTACLTALFASTALAESGMPSMPSIDTKELTGDVKLACEALLCLSSSARPGECSPSLDRYFNIVKKNWDQTLNARIDFLNLCPVMDSPGMPSLANAIANGAGYCDAAALNKNLVSAFRIYTYYSGGNGVRSSATWSAWREGKPPEEMSSCATMGSFENRLSDEEYTLECHESKMVINDKMPGQCLNYVGHEYTFFEPLHYEGDKFNGGKWVE